MSGSNKNKNFSSPTTNNQQPTTNNPTTQQPTTNNPTTTNNNQPTTHLTGTKRTFSVLNPVFNKNGRNVSNTSLYLSCDQPTISILLTAITNCLIPMDRTNVKCSFVCPPPIKPLSNSSCPAATTSSATSAWLAPLIMLGIKSLCPGASSKTTCRFDKLKFFVATSMVTPRSVVRFFSCVSGKKRESP